MSVIYRVRYLGRSSKSAVITYLYASSVSFASSYKLFKLSSIPNFPIWPRSLSLRHVLVEASPIRLQYAICNNKTGHILADHSYHRNHMRDARSPRANYFFLAKGLKARWKKFVGFICAMFGGLKLWWKCVRCRSWWSWWASRRGVTSCAHTPF